MGTTNLHEETALDCSGARTRPAIIVALRIALGVALAFSGARTHADSTPATIGTQVRAGEASGLTVDVKVQGPSAQVTPLQVACVFEYTEGDITGPSALPAAVNGMVHLDAGLHGLITDLRKSGKFAGHALETLLIVPPKGSISPERLLLIGLGDRKQFSAEVLRHVGAVEVREALRLGVTSFSHASDVKDAGVNSPAAADAVAVITGIHDGLAAQRYLADKGAGSKPTTLSVTYLAGPSFFAETTAALREALAHLRQR